ncbi:hypothetical protein FEM48_Zijuj09G0167200 [Ziziphus jujuba var. spinosa]|uniref:Trafficking protein particle complex subunit 2-like protein n=1 Tax=Ziziphus jujuba var. spinosa TaxID=714518 RepID=A0A978UU46_ZIZJJ|nr:hypothetical protein FEM48_Zijuj09G0167200 [Ziziphus jujuba var. spinosa]
MIVCVAVVGHQVFALEFEVWIRFVVIKVDFNLYYLKFWDFLICPQFGVVLCRKLLLNNPKKSGPTLNETFLGLLYPTENYKVYGYLTNTKVKFILVTTDLDVKDADVRNYFRSFHAAYVDAVSNPFHVPGKKITSKTFAERVTNIVKSFGFSSAA